METKTSHSSPPMTKTTSLCDLYVEHKRGGKKCVHTMKVNRGPVSSKYLEKVSK